MNTRKLNMNPSATSSATSNKKSFVKYGGIAAVIAAAMAGAAQYLHRHSDEYTTDSEEEHGDNPETDTDSHDATSEHVEYAESTGNTATDTSDNNVTSDTGTGTSSSTQNAKTTETKDTTAQTEDKEDDTPISNPEEVAQKIIAELEIDDDDIYDLALIRFDEFTTVYNEDGQELNAAIFHLLGETEPYVLVDMNGDGTYTHIFDSNLDLVDIPVLYPFNEDDIRYAMEEEMGYIGPKTLLADDEEELDDIDFNDIEEAEVAVADDIDYDDEEIRALIESFFDMPFEEFAEAYWDDDDEPDPEPVLDPEPEPDPDPEDISSEDEDDAYDADDDY